MGSFELIFGIISVFVLVDAEPHLKNMSIPEPRIGREDACQVYTYSGHPCIFPFEFKNGVYTNCTTVENYGRPWCKTQIYDGNRWWSRCSSVYCNYCTVYTVLGFKCILPFIYKGVEYEYCTDKDHHMPWCVDSRGKWDNCKQTVCGENCQVRTHRNKWCTFPFKYKNIWFDHCTEYESRNKPWCSHDTYYRNDWGLCRNVECP